MYTIDAVIVFFSAEFYFWVERKTKYARIVRSHIHITHTNTLSRGHTALTVYIFARIVSHDRENENESEENFQFSTHITMLSICSCLCRTRSEDPISLSLSFRRHPLYLSALAQVRRVQVVRDRTISRIRYIFSCCVFLMNDSNVERQEN